MKTLRHLFTALLLLCATAAAAHDFEVDGIYYNILSDEDKTVEVTYRGGYSNEYSGDVTIPANVIYDGTTYSVTTIGKEAFYNCSSFTSIEIPNSVTSIGNFAFYGCYKLKTIINLSNLTFYKGSDSYGYIALYADKVINAPNGFIDGDYVWCNKDNIYTLAGYSGNATELTLPADCNGSSYVIGNEAFSFCTSLTSVTIPNSVTTIGSSAFYNCSSLASIVIPNSVTTIGTSAFYNCSSLASVTIGNSVTTIGNSAFNGCASLSELHIADGDGTLSLGYNEYNIYGTGKGLFYDCPLETLYLGRDLSYSTSKSYGYSPFYNAKLTSVTIGNKVTTIGYALFAYCSSLTSIKIPNSVTTIERSAFKDCQRLISIEIPNSVTNIGVNAFKNCSNLASIEIPNSVTSIGNSAFQSCSSLASVTIGNGVTAIGESAFEGCSVLSSVEIPNSVTSIGDSAFNGCTSLKELHIADGDGTLSLGYNGYSSSDTGKGLFYDCPLETLYLGRDLSYGTSKSCGYSPFFNNAKLTSVTIGGSVTTIGDYAFQSCSSLASVTIGNGVTAIGESAFEGCSSLTNIEIPNSVTSIGNYAFILCI